MPSLLDLFWNLGVLVHPATLLEQSWLLCIFRIRFFELDICVKVIVFSLCSLKLDSIPLRPAKHSLPIRGNLDRLDMLVVLIHLIEGVLCILPRWIFHNLCLSVGTTMSTS